MTSVDPASAAVVAGTAAAKTEATTSQGTRRSMPRKPAVDLAFRRLQ
jgi:hypothetical protein